ncbi:hypothetical protein ACFUMH_10105 [Cellulomonas sp. NPDC057328]|uniref:hypothetical protein n=1 Tax=Cellulomonas sp. NPDC057328 TaxID=3346101 RepID=UPI00363BA739
MRSSSTDAPHDPTDARRADAPATGTWVRLGVALLVAAVAALTPAVGRTSALLTDTDDLTARVSTGTWVTPTPTTTPEPTPSPTDAAGTPAPGTTAAPTAAPTAEPAPASRRAPAAGDRRPRR